MKNSYKKIIILFLIISLSFFTCYLFNIRKNNNKNNIDVILKTDSYSYLPEEAKEYVKEVYKYSGNIILTEKNKKENVPYLNPSYVDYLSLSDKEKKKQEIIPETYVMDYIFKNVGDTNELPSYYNLTNVNGKNYTTPIKNQGNLGLCWAFTSAETVESFVLLNNDESYNSNSIVLSPRQIDYVTSTDGIKNYKNPYGYRELTSGGNFNMFSSVAAAGISLTSESQMPYDESNNKKELKDVLNYSNSNYYITSTINVPKKESFLNETEKKEYINLIKQYIMQYGGPYVGTQAPGKKSSCSALNTDQTWVLDIDTECSRDHGHGMQIIGWDDNYSYTYCSNNGKHSSDLDNCNPEDIVTGKGAWILRNSWGTEYPEFIYPYLTYNSLGSDINFISNLKATNQRNWDNSYGQAYYVLGGKIRFDEEGNAIEPDFYLTDYTQEYTTKHKELVKQVTFYNYNENADYKITIKSNDIALYEKNVSISNAGIYSIELNERVEVEKNVQITVSSTNDSYLLNNSVQLFTENVDKTPLIETEDKVVENDIAASSTANYQFNLYSDTRNIPSNSEITYSLYSEDGTNLSDKMTYQNNIVAMNNVLATVTIDRSVKAGNFIIKSSYNGYEYESKLTLGVLGLTSLYGSGTEEDPYLIHNEMELKAMGANRTSRQKFYKLVKDINLEGEFTPIGCSNSLCYPFEGGFDGDNHKITGMKITKKTGLYAGLFGEVEGNNTNNTYIKNLYIEDVDIDIDIDDSNSTGVLIGTITTSNDITIDSIYITGKFKTISGRGNGGLIGNIENDGENNKFVINNIYSSLEMFGSDNMGGIVGNINSSSNAISISNVQISNNFHIIGSEQKPQIGYVFSYNNQNSLDLKNFIITSRINYELHDDVIGFEPVYNFGNRNGYILNGESDYFEIKTINELKNPSLYSDWEDFNTYWEIKEVDSIGRIPVLKGANFKYTSIPNINIDKEENVSLYDYITPKIEASKNITCSLTNNSSIIELDNQCNITPINEGTATIHVLSEYDGYERDITVTVVDSEYKTIKYNSNTGTGTMDEDEILKGNEYTIKDNSFIKEGYKFIKWNTKEDGTGIDYNPNDVVTINEYTTLYAIWDPITYRVLYKANGGTGTMNSDKLVYDTETNLTKNVFKRNKYEFSCWNTKEDGTGTSYGDEALVKNLSKIEDDNIYLYAQWTKVEGEITFNSNGGTEETRIQDFKYNTDTRLGRNAFEKEGYTFVEWNTELDGTGTSYSDRSIINFSEDTTLYAQWDPITYTVIFNSNDLVNTTSIQELIYDQSEKLNKNTFVKTNYSFKNWNTESDGSGNPYIDEEEVLNLSSTQDDVINLYAQWEINKINVSFDSNTGIGTMDGYTTDSGITNNLPKNTFTKTGYIFKEWNTEIDGTGTSYSDRSIINFSEDTTLYAQWTPITYTVIFNSNDLDNVTSIQELTYDQSEKLNKNTFVKTNYSFKNWNTESDGSGNPYIDEEEVLNLSSTQDDVINLYAQWGNNVVNVDFNSNTGTGTMNRLTIDAGTTNTLPKNTFTKTRYIFKEWNTASDGTGISYADEQEISLENSITLYAQWEEKEYTVTLYKNDGTNEKSEINVGNLEEFEFYNAYSRENYNLLYWEDVDTGDEYYNNDTVVITSNKEFNAIWDKLSFEITFDPYENGSNVVTRNVQKNSPVFIFPITGTDVEFLGWKDRDTNTFYEPNQSIIPEDDMYLVGVWKDNTNTGYKINNYLVDETNKYISKVMVGTTLNNYRSNFELSSGYTINVQLKNDVLYTGSKTKIYNNNVLEDEYTNVVIGDINGDGIINSSDLLRVRQHLLGINVLEGYKFLSSDINYDNTINSSDLLRMRQHLIGSKSISE